MTCVILQCEQGDLSWNEARLGIPTASAFGRIVTPTGKLSEQRKSYLCDLLAEWALGYAMDAVPDLYWIDRGKALEAEARAYYELQTDIKTDRVGFVWRDADKLIGCSPDWLCDDPTGGPGGAELKCPAPNTHVSYMLREDIKKSYIPQVQGCMWVTGATWWHTFSYHPDLPPALYQVLRDPQYCSALDAAMPRFLDEMMEGRERLRSMGVAPATERAKTIAPEEARDITDYLAAG